MNLTCNKISQASVEEGVPVGSGPPSPTGSGKAEEGEVGSENATGVGTTTGEEQLLEQLSDASDTGWDTDLEIEGDGKKMLLLEKVCII